MSTIRVVVSDDHPIFREGLVRTLAEQPLFAVVGQASDAAGTVEIVRRTKPDLLLLDISMPGGGLQALREMAALEEPPVVAMLTVSEHDSDVSEALRYGARGYILKGIGARQLADVSRKLATGATYVSPSIEARMRGGGEAQSKKSQEGTSLSALTKREREILSLVSSGMSNVEVARLLKLREKTVKHYMTSVFQKLGVRNRVEASLVARQLWEP